MVQTNRHERKNPKGRVPKTNNLILMDKDYHKARSSLLHDYEESVNPFDDKYIVKYFVN